jgi:hypothetical protein
VNIEEISWVFFEIVGQSTCRQGSAVKNKRALKKFEDFQISFDVITTENWMTYSLFLANGGLETVGNPEPWDILVNVISIYILDISKIFLVINYQARQPTPIGVKHPVGWIALKFNIFKCLYLWNYSYFRVKILKPRFKGNYFNFSHNNNKS